MHRPGIRAAGTMGRGSKLRGHSGARAFWREPGIQTHGALGPWAIRASLVFFANAASRKRGRGYGFRAWPGMTTELLFENCLRPDSRRSRIARQKLI